MGENVERREEEMEERREGRRKGGQERAGEAPSLSGAPVQAAACTGRGELPLPHP